MREHARSLIVAVVAFAAACGPTTEAVRLPPLDPSATFAAHAVHGGFAVDRLAGAAARIDSRAFGMFVLRANDAAVAALWLTAPATVVARAGTSSGSPVTVTVEPSWSEQAIRVTLRSGTDTLHAGPFVRTDGRAGIPALSRAGQTTLDARGTYRAEVTGRDGESRGWFEVRVPGPDEPRVFSAALPHAPLEAGAALTIALASELDWIEDHSLDVYRGGGRERGGGRRGN
jgi:hypothetical protein